MACPLGAKVTNVHPDATLDKKVPLLLRDASIIIEVPLVSVLCCFVTVNYPQNAFLFAKKGEKYRNCQL